MSSLSVASLPWVNSALALQAHPLEPQHLMHRNYESTFGIFVLSKAAHFGSRT
jgi:hypothetical protein